MNLYDAIVERKEKISVVGLGYVGLPITIAFAKVADVVGFDINEEKVRQYQQGIDATKEVGDEAVQETTAFLTWEEKYLRDCKFHGCGAQSLGMIKHRFSCISRQQNSGRNLLKAQ